MKNNSNKNTKKQTATTTKRLFAKNARPKMVKVILERGTRGNYHVMGAEYLDEINQYRASWRSLDARDTAYELRRAAKAARMLTVN